MIPNIVKGRGVSGALKYVLSEGHVEKKEEAVTYALMRAAGDPPTKTYKELAANDISRAEILGGQNFGFEVRDARTVELARRMMEWNGHPDNQGSKTRKCEIDCFHAMLNWEPGEKPDKAEQLDAANGFLKALGMENAQAVFVAHHDKDHHHLHIVASRIDPASGKTYSQKDDFSIAQAWGVQWDRAHGIERESGLHSVAGMVERRDYDGLLDHFTKDRPTFLAPTVNHAMRLGGLNDEQKAGFRAELMAHPSIVPLRDHAEGDVTRYTTRDILKSEMRAMRDAATLDADKAHGIAAQKIERIAEQFTLKPEQAAAARHMTDEAGLSILWGEAGTGKSHTLKAARTAYEEDGAKVIGLSWTNKVIQDMRANGFENCDTVTRQLNALRKGKTQWDENTVIVVDEAAMLSSKALGDVLSHAARAGAKVILAGDDAQLNSIEPGGLFGKLREQFGAATLTEVQRTTDADQQRAFNSMHSGDFKTALEIFDSKGAILWTEKQSAAQEQMAAAYAAAVEAAPEKSRFMFAYTNKDVAALNEQARELHKARGDLGEDVMLKTAYGPQAYATGDRIQFTGNAWTQEARESGLVNGRVGTVEAVEIDKQGRAHMTVALDSGENAQRVTFTIGEDARGGEFNSFKRGYAGTIYKGQGATLDESFVLADDKWRSSAAYVAMSRHRESLHVFTSRECFDDLTDMARSFARSDGKDAAISYVIDNATLLDLAAEIAAERHAGNDAGQTVAPAGDREQVSENAPGSSVASEAVADAAESAVGEALEIVAEGAGKAIEALASLFDGGGSPPKKAKPRKRDRVEEFLDAEKAAREQRKAAHQELTRLFGQEVSEEEGKDIARDRGGGISRD